jgi:hypothetical protein
VLLRVRGEHDDAFLILADRKLRSAMTMVVLPDLSFVARFRLWSAELVGLRLPRETVDRYVYDVADRTEDAPTSGVNAAGAARAVH